MIITKKRDMFTEEVYFNTKKIGDFILQSSGGYLFFDSSEGAWSEYGLFKVAEKLKEINEEFYKSMQNI